MDIKNNIYICEKEPMLSFTAFLRCLCAPPISYFSCIYLYIYLHIYICIHMYHGRYILLYTPHLHLCKRIKKKRLNALYKQKNQNKNSSLLLLQRQLFSLTFIDKTLMNISYRTLLKRYVYENCKFPFNM